jgi:biopolymer transport protein ExbD
MRKMFFKEKGRKKSEPMEIDITSLLDILVILLVFLLKSYNASNLKLNLVKNLQVPKSQVRKLGAHSVIVQVDKDKNIWIKRKKVGSVKTSQDKISALYSALELEQKQYQAKNKKKNTAINLVFDKELPYSQIKKIMHTSALAGYSEFKFIVQGNY